MIMISNFFSQLFFNLLINSLKACVLILIILFIRKIFINKVSIKLLYSLWFIVILRLILPFNFNFFNLVNLNNLQNTYFDYSNTEIIHQVNIIKNNTNPSFLISQNTILAIAAIIWLMCISLLITKKIIVYILFLKKLKNASEIKDKKIRYLFKNCIKTLNIKSSVRLLETSIIKSPCLFGILNKKILIPVNLVQKLETNELKCIFYHELLHIKNHDITAGAITQLLNIIYFFNPLISYAFKQMRNDCEYLCDYNSIILSKNDPYTYGNTLLKILNNIKTSKKKFFITGIFSLLAALNNKKHFKRRLQMICNRPKRSIFISLLSATVLLAIFGATFTGSLFAETNGKSSKILFYNPVDSPRITLKFGNIIDPISKKERFHNGIDLAKQLNAPVKASSSGTIIKIEDNENATLYGKFIIIAHKNGFTTLYSKLNAIKVKQGQKVKAGDIIGLIGSTGRSTGPHLHFEIRKDDKPVNPEDFIDFTK